MMARKTETHAVVTGPVTGTVTLPDGREVDVNPSVVMVANADDAKALADAIGRKHTAVGHPTDTTFTYTPPED